MKPRALLSRKQRLAVDECGATSPEYGILLVIGLTTAMSIGMLLRDAVNDGFDASALRTQRATQQPNRHSVTSNSVPLYRTTASNGDHARSFLIIVQTTLALALIVMIVRRTRTDKKEAKPLRTRECLDDQLKNILLALRHQSLDGDPLEPLVGQVMNTNVATVFLQAPSEEVASFSSSMHEAVFVLGQEKALVGQISGSTSIGGSVRQAMNDVPMVLSKSTRVSTALRNMLEQGCTVAPVLHNGKLCGVVSRIDIMLTLMAMIQLFKETQLRHREMMIDACGTTASFDDLSAR